MSMRRISFHRSKSGMATVLGTLIFIGILFTCAIPFYLRINQANTYYTQVVDEMRRFDEKRGMEDIDVYAYPLSETSNELNVYIKNRCALSVTIVTMWVNAVQHKGILVNPTIPSMEDQTYGPIPVTPEEGEDFYIEVLTNRGNRFASLTNPLTYTGGTWYGGLGLSINIVFGYHGYFHFVVEGPAETSEGDVYRPPHSDVLKRVDVAIEGTYHVTVTPRHGTPVEEDVFVSWSTPSVWVYIREPG